MLDYFLFFVMGYLSGALLHPPFLKFLERYVDTYDRKHGCEDPFPFTNEKSNKDTSKSC